MSTQQATGHRDEGEERRSGIDRRKPPSFPPVFSSHRRRRSKGRRRTDRAGYVDIYDARTWALAIGVLALSFLDAVMTVFLVRRGSVSEANPLMDAVMSWGGFYAFFGVKAALTAFPLAIIILHKEWKLARFVAWLCLLAYVLVSLYHIFLFFVSAA